MAKMTRPQPRPARACDAIIPFLLLLDVLLLPCAHRLDPGNLMLQADALEVAAVLRPDSCADAEAVKARADARFRAGDMQGASDAYTALLALLQQQDAQLRNSTGEKGGSARCTAGQSSSKTQLLVAALSNRAACWLALGSHHCCVADCSAGLAAILSPVAAAGGDVSAQAGSSGGDAPSVLQQQEPAQLQGGLADPQLARSAARLAARLAAAHTCLKQTAQADVAYAWAAGCWAALGEHARATALNADRRRVLPAVVAQPAQPSCC